MRFFFFFSELIFRSFFWRSVDKERNKGFVSTTIAHSRPHYLSLSPLASVGFVCVCVFWLKVGVAGTRASALRERGLKGQRTPKKSCFETKLLWLGAHHPPAGRGES